MRVEPELWTTLDEPFICSTDLYMHLDNGFPDQSCSKESPEGNQEMPTGYSSQVKERIGNLKNAQENELLSCQHN